jgi:excisionase family DNA binding protein
MGDMMQTKNLLTTKEVAARLRCSKWGIYALVRTGRLASVRLSSRRLLFSESAVEDAIRRAERHANEDGASLA